MESKTIFVTLNGTFKDAEKCRIAMETIVKDAHAAFGVHSHFWFRSEDGKSLFVLEQYENNKALSQAIRRFTSARMSFFNSIKDISISVYGNISKGNKLMFAALRPQYMDYYDGYSKPVAKTKESGIKTSERNRILVALNGTVKAGSQHQDALQMVLNEAQGERGMKTHFWCRAKDGKSLFLLEQFEDEKALIDHFQTASPSRAALLNSMSDLERKVYGKLEDQTTPMPASNQTSYMEYLGGYSK